MDSKKPKIYIVGAGISGLVAAKVLEENDISATILEATETPGGRVKTDTIDGISYDHGFQVLLTDYPKAQKYLDYEALDLAYFKPGALIFKDGKTQRIGDPLRDFSVLLPTLTAKVGSLRDKWKIFTLSRKLKSRCIHQIFSSKEQTTLSYLQEYGFSDDIIQNFFKPFFTGIFLEEKLNTSSRLFEFILKMFGEGYAAVPKAGIGAMSKQLADRLTKTQIDYNTEVAQIEKDAITLINGTKFKADAVISTLPLDAETGNLSVHNLAWKSCDNLYFTIAKRSFDEGIIGLVADNTALVNNLYYPFEQQSDGKALLSVTVVKNHQLNEAALVVKVKEELKVHCGITSAEFLKNYHIQQALPDVTDAGMFPSEEKLISTNGVFLAGDYLLSGSLNAAMATGEGAANAVLKRFK